MDMALEREHRRAQGAFFTPEPLVQFVVANVLSARLRQPLPKTDLRILDPACGDGRFLAAARRFLKKKKVKHALIGLERDPAFFQAAERTLGPVVHRCEALCEPPAVVGQGVDVVIGNPPYLRSIHLGNADDALRTRLRGRYAATSHGEWDLYAAFLEQALDWTRPGGEVGLVVPSRWMTAAFAENLRRKFAQKAAVRGIIDFGANQLFPGATTYISVAFLSRTPRPRVFVARFRTGQWHVGTVPSKSLSGAPWRLAVGPSAALLDKLAARGPRLGQVARIAKGTGTNADKVFVFEAGDNKPAVESELLMRCLRGRDVVAYGSASADVQCLVPYDRDGNLIPFAEIKRQFPAAAAYLSRHKKTLEARERGRFRGPDFHCFGRPQNLLFHREHAGKVVVPDVSHGGRALLDRSGALVLDSAYAIRPTDPETSIELILAIMNSNLVRLWLIETGVPLRGDYIRQKTAYLTSLPLPPRSQYIQAIEDAVTQRADAAFIDDLVRKAYGLSPTEWTATSVQKAAPATSQPRPRAPRRGRRGR
jgi:SAM-dependent methyltransferase